MVLRGPKMGSKRPIKSFKVAKTCICKNHKKTFGFLWFWGFQGRPRQPWKAQEGSQEAPTELQRLYKDGPKMETILTSFCTTFGALLKAHLAVKIGSRGGPKMGSLLEPPCPASQGSRAHAFRNYTRGVKKLLELELYSPKREG